MNDEVLSLAKDLYYYTQGIPVSKKAQLLAEAEARVKQCTKCKIAKTRKNVVYGGGKASAKLLFIGEAPGVEEDIQGIPFVGRAGKLLNEMLESVGFSRDDAYICNVLKCHPHPPENTRTNRAPNPEEIANCAPWLDEQLQIIKPKFICLLGNPAMDRILGMRGITQHAGKLYEYKNTPTMPIYHPSWGLRSPDNKQKLAGCFRTLRREYDNLFGK